jgi:hypothetical protein
MVKIVEVTMGLVHSSNVENKTRKYVEFWQENFWEIVRLKNRE